MSQNISSYTVSFAFKIVKSLQCILKGKKIKGLGTFYCYMKRITWTHTRSDDSPDSWKTYDASFDMEEIKQGYYSLSLIT